MDKIFSQVNIRTIATALPKEKMEMTSLYSLYGEDLVKKIVKTTEIQEVHCSPEGKTSSDYCIAAAQSLFEKSDVHVGDVDGLVFVTETPDYIMPHTSAAMQERLGLPNHLIAFDINYGCAGYVYGLFQASLLIAAGYCRNVLLCVGDTPTKYIHPQDRPLRMVFGDAGSATILSYDEHAADSAFAFYTDGGKSDQLTIPAGGSRMPCKHGVTDVVEQDEEGNGRTLENIYMDGIGIMNFALHNVKGVIHEALELTGLSLEEVDLFALHQANALIVKYLAKRLGADKAKVPFGAGMTGNTTCTSIPLMLSELYSGRNESFRKVLACGFGTGLSCAAGIIDLSGTEILSPIEI